MDLTMEAMSRRSIGSPPVKTTTSGSKLLHHVGEVGHLVAVGDLPVVAEVAARVAALGDLDGHRKRPPLDSAPEVLSHGAELVAWAESDFHARAP